MEAVHRCKYSNGVIGITEELSPVQEKADHWNFNVRFPNPGGNHGSFFRISTHSVWMTAGAGVPVRELEEPYDSLNFASTVLTLTEHTYVSSAESSGSDAIEPAGRFESSAAARGATEESRSRRKQ